jgi:hypothetical protein
MADAFHCFEPMCARSAIKFVKNLFKKFALKVQYRYKKQCSIFAKLKKALKT